MRRLQLASYPCCGGWPYTQVHVDSTNWSSGLFKKNKLNDMTWEAGGMAGDKRGRWRGSGSRYGTYFIV